MVFAGLFLMDEPCGCKITDVSVEGYPADFFVGEDAPVLAREKLMQLQWALDAAISAERVGSFKRNVFVRRYWMIHTNGKHVLGLVR